ncbi:MAG: DNA-directed RNA polymerase subunit omega [Clostridia bacterium]|nr:DNA-directed RNA polymerase subunit omega [Clostridia bacterium]
MIEPSIKDLTKDRFNRYTLVIAAAKSARMITDEYMRQREIAEKKVANKETDKSVANMINREYRDEKAVKTAINHMYAGDFAIVGYDDEAIAAAEARKAAQAEAEAAVEQTTEEN